MTSFVNNHNRKDEYMELLGELIQACLEEDGYQVKNFMDTKRTTTAYGGMFITLRDGRKVSLTYDFTS